MFRCSCKQLSVQPGKLAILMFFGLFCSALAAHEATHHHKQHIKPGADVVFEHNYDGSTAVGEVENIELRFSLTVKSEESQVRIYLRSNENLQIHSQSQFNFSVGGANTAAHSTEIVIPLSLSSKIAQQYHLGIVLEVVNSQGTSSARVFELPLSVGRDSSQPQKTGLAASQEIVEDHRGRKLIIMDAREN